MPSAEPPPSAKPVAPPPPAAASRPTNPAPGNAAQLGKSLKVKGEIAGSEDLYIDGEVEGKITLQGNNLTIGPNGNVRAEVTAHSITVLGRLQGNVRAADRVEIRKTGSLEGDLVTARIAIEEDAVFR
jgi:cytoskeletal protein CcmA (bactofilin family)